MDTDIFFVWDSELCFLKACYVTSCAARHFIFSNGKTELLYLLFKDTLLWVEGEKKHCTQQESNPQPLCWEAYILPLYYNNFYGHRDAYKYKVILAANRKLTAVPLGNSSISAILIQEKLPEEYREAESTRKTLNICIEAQSSFLMLQSQLNDLFLRVTFWTSPNYFPFFSDVRPVSAQPIKTGDMSFVPQWNLVTTISGVRAILSLNT